jgi:hypothetical protein
MCACVCERFWAAVVVKNELKDEVKNEVVK